jgi:hypothetical protein
MFDSWLRSPIVSVVRESLSDSLNTDNVVIGDAALAKALIAAGLATRVAGISGRAAKRFTSVVAGTSTQLDLADQSVDAVIGVVSDADEKPNMIDEWIRVVKPGGNVMLVSRGSKEAGSARALCAGLGAIEQRGNGRTIVTVGVVRR